jgi:hypothetical protein
VCIWFDAWRYARHETALWRTLLLHTVEELSRRADAGRLEIGDLGAFNEEIEKLRISLYRSWEYEEKGGWRVNWEAAAPLAARTALRLISTLVPGAGIAEEALKAVNKATGEGQDAKEATKILEREHVKRFREQIDSLEQFYLTISDLIQNISQATEVAHSCLSMISIDAYRNPQSAH